MSKLAKALTAAAGNAGGTLGYVEDVFSTYLYTGQSSNQTIINGIDLDGEGGLVWLKNRDLTRTHVLFDTERGLQAKLATNSTSGNVTEAASSAMQSFNADGFTLGWGAGEINQGGFGDYASWTFRKAEKFFDVVTYTGNGTTQEISHNLGVAPSFIIVKETSTTRDWVCYHSALGETYRIFLNATNAAINSSSAIVWGNNTTAVAPTDSVFTVGNAGVVNNSGGTYVAYLFASDAGGFGDDGSESIIKCGSYEGNGGSSLNSVTLGFEPQWILLKNADATGSWAMYDTMRGWAVSASNADDARLFANSSGAESLGNAFNPTATGFEFQSGNATWNNSGNTFIYIAIRRPMKTPESGTEVFNSLAYTGDGASTRDFDLGMTVDAYFQACRSSSTYDFKNLTSRLTAKGLHTAGTGTEFTTNTSLDVQDGLRAIGFENTLNQSGETYIINGFKRATGFFDVVAYSGNSTAGHEIKHNLGVTPEFMIQKVRNDTTSSWYIYHKDLNVDGDGLAETDTMRLYLDSAAFDYPVWNDTAPTSTSFYLGGGSFVNQTGDNYITYLFASVAGVSKVGSYTGNGGSSVQQIDCGFSSGARFILIKDADGANDWYVWDSARGIVAGNDPYLRLNQTAAENPDYDWVDPYSAGFEVTTDATAAFRINVSGRKYIFLAIA